MRRVQVYKTKAAGSRELYSQHNSPIIIEARSFNTRKKHAATDIMRSLNGTFALPFTPHCDCATQTIDPKYEDCGTQVGEGMNADVQQITTSESLVDDWEFIQFLKTISLFCQKDSEPEELLDSGSDHRRLYRNLLHLRETFQKYREITRSKREIPATTKTHHNKPQDTSSKELLSSSAKLMSESNKPELDRVETDTMRYRNPDSGSEETGYRKKTVSGAVEQNKQWEEPEDDTKLSGRELLASSVDKLSSNKPSQIQEEYDDNNGNTEANIQTVI